MARNNFQPCSLHRCYIVSSLSLSLSLSLSPFARTHTHTHTHTHSLSLSLTHTHTHARTQTHTHTQSFPLASSRSVLAVSAGYVITITLLLRVAAICLNNASPHLCLYLVAAPLPSARFQACIGLPVWGWGGGGGGHLPLLWQIWGLRVPTACLYSRTQLWNMGVVVCSVRELMGSC